MRRVPQCVESPRLKSQKLQQEQKKLNNGNLCASPIRAKLVL